NAGALVASIPLSLSMGAAEWSLLWYRRRTRRLLRTTTQFQVFARRAREALVLALTQYMAGTIVLVTTGAVIAVGTGLVYPDQIIVPEAAGYLVLGSAMFLALLLQTMRIRAVPLAAVAVALAAEIIFHGYGVTTELAVPVVLFIVVGCYSLAQLSAA